MVQSVLSRFYFICRLLLIGALFSILFGTAHARAALCDEIKSLYNSAIWQAIPEGYNRLQPRMPLSLSPQLFGDGCRSYETFSKGLNQPIFFITLSVSILSDVEAAQYRLGLNYKSAQPNGAQLVRSLGDIGGYAVSWRTHMNHHVLSATKGKHTVEVKIEGDLPTPSLERMANQLFPALYNAVTAQRAGVVVPFPIEDKPRSAETDCNPIVLFGIPSSDPNCEDGSAGQIANVPQIELPDPFVPPVGPEVTEPLAPQQEEPQKASGRFDPSNTVFEDYEQRSAFYKVITPEERTLVMFEQPRTDATRLAEIEHNATGIRVLELLQAEGYVWANVCTGAYCGYVVASYLDRQPSDQPDTFASAAESDVAVHLYPAKDQEVLAFLPYGLRVSVWQYADVGNLSWIYICDARFDWCGWAEQERFFQEN